MQNEITWTQENEKRWTATYNVFKLAIDKLPHIKGGDTYILTINGKAMVMPQLSLKAAQGIADALREIMDNPVEDDG